MEVHVRNVPQQSTENALRKSLKPYFAALSIRCVHVLKQNGKSFASLTFLHLDDAKKFLLHHGQTRNDKGRPTRTNPSISINIKFLGQPIYCEQSKRVASQHLLRVLGKEEKDRKAKAATASHVQQPKAPRSLPVTFNCWNVSCGTLRYSESVGSTPLIFRPEVTWNDNTLRGKVKFGERSMVLTLDSGLRIDFHYWAVYEIIMEVS